MNDAVNMQYSKRHAQFLNHQDQSDWPTELFLDLLKWNSNHLCQYQAQICLTLRTNIYMNDSVYAQITKNQPKERFTYKTKPILKVDKHTNNTTEQHQHKEKQWCTHFNSQLKTVFSGLISCSTGHQYNFNVRYLFF